MKKFLFAFLCACFLTPFAHGQAKDISGVYENKNAIVTITKDDYAWKLECGEEDDWQEHTFLSKEKKNMTDPFEPTMNCAPRRKLTDNVYRVTIKAKTKIECRIIPKANSLAEYHPDFKILAFHPYMEMNFLEKQPYIRVNKPGLFDEDCGKLSEGYKKIK